MTDFSGFTFEITDTTADPFYQGAGAADDVPGDYDIAINGKGFMLDKKHQAFQQGITTIPLIRNQADNSVEPGEATVNPEDLWQRSQHTWHKGAGQIYLDEADGDRSRFHESKGVYVWERGQLTLLNQVWLSGGSSNTNYQALRVGDYLYESDGTDLSWFGLASTSGNANIQAGETPIQNIKSITSDGYYIVAALGSLGIHTTTRGALTSTHYSALSCTLVGYAKGRLMAANGNSIYNVIASGAAPSAMFTHNAIDFKWIGFAEGMNHIYAAGYSGGHSQIYKIGVQPEGTSLTAPSVAGELPIGEEIMSIQGYLGFVLIGTKTGLRVATSDGNGNLTIGPLIETGAPVRCFYPEKNFVYFGWENYAFNGSVTSGLGRLDLTQFNDSGAPAYATDLMTTKAGTVMTMGRHPDGYMIIGVTPPAETSGWHVEQLGIPLYEGTIRSGKIGYGLADPKTALRFSVNHQPLKANGAVTGRIIADGNPSVFLGTSDKDGTTRPDEAIKVPEVSAQYFELDVTLTCNQDNSPVVERYDLRAYPTALRGTEIIVPILLHEKVKTVSGRTETVNVKEMYDRIKGYEGSRELVSYQELSTAFSSFVEEMQFERQQATHDRKWWNGTLVVKFKVLGD